MTFLHCKRFGPAKAVRGSLIIACVLSQAASTKARLMEGASFREMFDKANVVAIAVPVRSEKTQERRLFLDGFAPVMGINTEFEIRLVLKGNRNLRKLVLHHYKLVESDGVALVGGPALVSFDVKKHETFLLFLRKEQDGRYAPVAGQVDPKGYSVSAIDSLAE